MKKLILLAVLFATGVGAGMHTMTAAPAEAAPNLTCLYCRGTSCGRGTLGKSECLLKSDGTCEEWGEDCMVG